MSYQLWANWKFTKSSIYIHKFRRGKDSEGCTELRSHRWSHRWSHRVRRRRRPAQDPSGPPTDQLFRSWPSLPQIEHWLMTSHLFDDQKKQKKKQKQGAGPRHLPKFHWNDKLSKETSVFEKWKNNTEVSLGFLTKGYHILKVFNEAILRRCAMEVITTAHFHFPNLFAMICSAIAMSAWNHSNWQQEPKRMGNMGRVTSLLAQFVFENKWNSSCSWT